jgi:phosphonate transport system permease protein
MGIALGGGVGVLLFTDVTLAGLTTERRLGNLQRFLGELGPPAGQSMGEWLGTVSVVDAVLPTVAMAVVAMVLAAVLGGLSALLASRRLMQPDPWVRGQHAGPASRAMWAVLGGFSRFTLVCVRAIPTYIWAYILLLLLGLGAWPAVLAIALHNGGILGRLGSELVDDLPPNVAGAVSGVGASRWTVAVLVLAPQALSRALLYFFVRMETAIREATVLGMLGFVSLGWFVADARVRMRMDLMVLYVGLAVLTVICIDVLSIAVRRRIRL